MPGTRRARDLELLDAVDALDRVEVGESVWRAVREGRDPLMGHPSGGRWDPGIFDVLYTAFDPDGAIAEIEFQLSRQPVFPSKVEYILHEIQVKTQATLRFEDLQSLEELGVEVQKYSSVLYTRTQEIGDAAAFLGFDGIIAPNARWDCLNLVLFTDHVRPDDLELKSSTPIDFNTWRRKRGG